MPTYEKAIPSVMSMMAGVIKEHHPDLKRAGVRVMALMAAAARDSDGNPKGPAIKLHGYQCAGIISILPLKMRVMTDHDALMILDGDRFDDWTDDTQRALIDHELTHLEVVWEVAPSASNPAQGIAATDDHQRPKLKLRLHDWELGGFKQVAERWGKASFDVLEARKFNDAHGPVLFDDHDDDERELRIA